MTDLFTKIIASNLPAAEREELLRSNAKLLDALEEIEQQIDYGQLPAALKIARAAIAAAQGEKA